MIISLGEPLPTRSSGLPGAQGKRATSRPQMRTLPLLGLAPGGGYLATGITTGAGGLLHHLFTITTRARKHEGYLFLWPCPAGYPAPGVTRHRALWSADFPQPRAWRGRDHPTDLEHYL